MYPLNLLIMFAAITKGAVGFSCPYDCAHTYLFTSSEFKKSVQCDRGRCYISREVPFVTCDKDDNITNYIPNGSTAWLHKTLPATCSESKYRDDCPYSPNDMWESQQIIFWNREAIGHLANITNPNSTFQLPNRSFNEWVRGQLSKLGMFMYIDCCSDPKSSCLNVANNYDDSAFEALKNIEIEALCGVMNAENPDELSSPISKSYTNDGLSAFAKLCSESTIISLYYAGVDMRALICRLGANDYDLPRGKYFIAQNTGEVLSFDLILMGIQDQDNNALRANRLNFTAFNNQGSFDKVILFTDYTNDNELWCMKNTPQKLLNWALWGSICGAVGFVAACVSCVIIRTDRCKARNNQSPGLMLAESI